MALTFKPVFIQTVKVTPQSFVNADGTAKKTIYTAGANGSKVVTIVATSTDTSDRFAQLWLTRSATSFLITTTKIALGSGTDGTLPSVYIINATILPGLPVDNVKQTYITLQSGDTLQVSMTVAVTAAKEIDLVTMGADF